MGNVSVCLHDTYHHQPVDSEFVEGLSKAEVVEAEEDGPEEADADHREEPVLAVHVGGGGAHDAEEGEDLNTGRLLKVSLMEKGLSRMTSAVLNMFCSFLADNTMLLRCVTFFKAFLVRKRCF